MLKCDPQTLTELDKLIAELASGQLTEPFLRIRSSSYQDSTEMNRTSEPSNWTLLNATQMMSSKKMECHSTCLSLSFIFLGQLLATGMTAIPLFNHLKLVFDEESQLWASGTLLAIPFLLSVFDSYRSIFSEIHEAKRFEKEILNASIRIHSINGFPTSLKLSHYKKSMWLISLLQIIGSLFIPVCYAFTAADITFSASESSSLSIIVFSLSLISFLLESQINHSFFLLARFVSIKEKNIELSPNKLEQLWIGVGCWLNMKRRFIHGIHMLAVLSISFAVPHYIIDNTDSSPNHLFWGGLMGLSAASCLAQLAKNYNFIQSQNKQLKITNACAEKIRCLLLDRPELALLWEFSTRLNTQLIFLFSFFTVALISLPVFNQMFFMPSLAAYHADACVFSLGTLFFIFMAHSLLSKCREGASQQMGHSTWESLLLACSTSALIALLGEYTDYDTVKAYIKVISFVILYLVSSLVVTTRDYTLNQAKINNLFWQSPIIQYKKRVLAHSDSILYSQSKNPLQQFKAVAPGID